MNFKLITISIFLLFTATASANGIKKSKKMRQLQITKEITIAAPLSDVYNMVQYLENFPKWSPFLEADPDQEYHVEGNDGTLGAQYHWTGNNGKDLGYQEIVKLDEGRFVGMQCDIQKPFKATPTFDYTFEETDHGVRVTQEFSLESKPVDAFFMWLFGAKKDIEKMNERGLTLLKIASEK